MAIPRIVTGETFRDVRLRIKDVKDIWAERMRNTTVEGLRKVQSDMALAIMRLGEVDETLAQSAPYELLLIEKRAAAQLEDR